MDDDPRALSALDITLRSGGFDNLVLCADDPDVRAAIGRAPYALVIVDLNTPLASAKGVLSLIAGLGPMPMPMLVMAGTPFSRACPEPREAGGIDCLLKPVDRERLLAAVRRALGDERPGLST